jgi:hypothetical protein
MAASPMREPVSTVPAGRLEFSGSVGDTAVNRTGSLATADLM